MAMDGMDAVVNKKLVVPSNIRLLNLTPVIFGSWNEFKF